MCEKVSIYKGFRAFGKPATESRLHAPKASALPLSKKAVRTHLDKILSCLIQRELTHSIIIPNKA